MKHLFILLVCFLVLSGCVSSGGYEEGYAAGYDAGYKAALESRAMPEFTAAPTPLPTSTPRPTSTSRPEEAPATKASTSDDFTVYVSRNGIIHKKSNCSGMLYYTEMLYSEALKYYDHKCSKCFK